jgi:hypothetical protein
VSAKDLVLLLENAASLRRFLGKLPDRAGYAFDGLRRTEEELSQKTYLRRRAQYLTKIPDPPLNSSHPVLKENEQ